MRGLTKCNIVYGLVLAGVLNACTAAALAQYGAPAITSQSPAARTPPSALNVDRAAEKIMPGDSIAIETLGAPELTTISTSVSPGLKVGSQGEIVVPYLGAVKVAGMTPSEASIYLSNALKDGGFLVDPQVSVQLVDSPTRIITVVGEVQKSVPVPAFGDVRLLDAISVCGGFTPMAGHTVVVHRRGNPNPIDLELGTNPDSADLSNIPLVAGDTVVVPKVGNVFIVGEVKTPEAIPLSNNAPITVMRAIAIAGGLKYSAALSKARIIRTTSDNQHIEIMLDLKKLMQSKQSDVAMASDDILFIPANAFKAALAGGGASVAAQTGYYAAYISYLMR